MLLQSSFVRWANENLVPLVAHNERLHPEEEAEVTGDGGGRCTLYPGLSCRDHVRAAVDIDNAREEHLVKVPFVELCPNTWLVLPTGEVERVEEEVQFDPKAIRRQAEAAQERLGTPLPSSAARPVDALLREADRAYEDDAWRRALEALARIETHATEPPSSLTTLVEARMAKIDEWVAFEAEDLLETEGVDDDVRKRVRALLEAVEVEVYGRTVPIRETLRAWLDAHR